MKWDRRTHGLLIVSIMAIWIVGYSLANRAGQAQAVAERAHYAAVEAQQSAEAAARHIKQRTEKRRRGRRGLWPFS